MLSCFFISSTLLYSGIFYLFQYNLNPFTMQATLLAKIDKKGAVSTLHPSLLICGIFFNSRFFGSCDYWLTLMVNYRFCNSHLLDIFIRWNFEHNICHNIFKNATQTSSTCFTFNSNSCYLTQSFLIKFKLNIIKLKQFFILFNQCIFFFFLNTDKSFLI